MLPDCLQVFGEELLEGCVRERRVGRPDVGFELFLVQAPDRVPVDSVVPESELKCELQKVKP